MPEQRNNLTTEQQSKGPPDQKIPNEPTDSPSTEMPQSSRENELDYEDQHRRNWWARVWMEARMPHLHRETVGARGLQAVDSRHGRLTPATEVCRTFASKFPRARGLFLFGPVGCGKTLLAVATAHEVAATLYHSMPDWWDMPDRTPRIRFATMPELLYALRSTFDRSDPGQPTFSDVDSEYRYADLLILDDVGAEKVSDWTCDVLFQFVDYRYRESRPTIFTSNLALDRLSVRLTDRIADRIYEMCKGSIVNIRVDSFRVK